MTIQNAQVGVPVLFTTTANCQNSCDSACADFTIKRHDTYPPFRVSAEDCAGALDLSDPNLVLEASMWTSAKLKADLTNNPTDPDYQVFQLAGNRGFDQIMVGDIIVMAQARLPEQMLIIGFDEADKYIYVQRGYHGTTVAAWKKGTYMKIFRMLNAQPPQTAIEQRFGDDLGIDGSIHRNVPLGTYLVCNWIANDTCLAGCYMLEFKLLKMTSTTTTVPSWVPPWPLADSTISWPIPWPTGIWPTPTAEFPWGPQPWGEGAWPGPGLQPWGEQPWGVGDPPWESESWDVGAWGNWPWVKPWDYYPNISATPIPSYSVPSVPSLSPTTGDYGCDVGIGVEWVRRFPVDKEGFVIKIEESPTSETVY